MSKAAANRHLDQSRERLMSVDRVQSMEPGFTTLNDVIKHVKENNWNFDSVYFDISDPDGIIHGPSLFFASTSPETDEEWAFRLKRLDELEALDKEREIKEAALKERAKQKKEEKERAAYERLKAKFG
jgi:hypothetical protein